MGGGGSCLRPWLALWTPLPIARISKVLSTAMVEPLNFTSPLATMSQHMHTCVWYSDMLYSLEVLSKYHQRPIDSPSTYHRRSIKDLSKYHQRLTSLWPSREWHRTYLNMVDIIMTILTIHVLGPIFGHPHDPNVHDPVTSNHFKHSHDSPMTKSNLQRHHNQHPH